MLTTDRTQAASKSSRTGVAGMTKSIVAPCKALGGRTTTPRANVANPAHPSTTTATPVAATKPRGCARQPDARMAPMTASSLGLFVAPLGVSDVRHRSGVSR